MVKFENSFIRGIRYKLCDFLFWSNHKFYLSGYFRFYEFVNWFNFEWRFNKKDVLQNIQDDESTIGYHL